MSIEFVSKNHYPLKTRIIVLINEYTSNMAEMLAAALRDNKRAIIVGVKSRGNGTLYASKKTLTSESLYLRSGFITTSKGVPIEGNGVMPDLVIKNSDALRDHALADVNMRVPRINDFQLQGILNLFDFIR